MSHKNINRLSRRRFLGTTLLGAAGVSLLPGLSFASFSANDTINLGVIGLGRQAMGLTNAFLNIPGVNIVAGSDVYGVKRKRFEKVVGEFYTAQKQKSKIKTYEHYHDLLSRKDIDGVVIASPDHWHALMAIDAAKAGKDIYLEKPLTFTIKEGKELVKAVRKNKRILQVGSQQRSSPIFQHAVKAIHEGKIGTLQRINAHIGGPPTPYDLPKETVPADLNWELWIGPGEMVHYNAQLNPPISLDPLENEKIWGAWRWYKELGGGFTTDWGAHMFDIAQWAMKKDHGGPVEIIPAGYQDYDFLTYKYDNGVVMTERPFNENNDKGVKFWGSDGWIEVTRSFLKTSDPELEFSEENDNDPEAPSHHRIFTEAMRSRKDPNVPVEIGHRSCTVCTLGNIAYELERPIQWDAVKENFVNDPEAENHLHRPYREGYTLG